MEEGEMATEPNSPATATGPDSTPAQNVPHNLPHHSNTRALRTGTPGEEPDYARIERQRLEEEAARQAATGEGNKPGMSLTAWLMALFMSKSSPDEG
jgi:hypothetical protein